LQIVKRELLKIRFRWTESDNGEDNELTQDEFLRFRHPELSDNSYRYIVDDIFARLGMSISDICFSFNKKTNFILFRR